MKKMIYSVLQLASVIVSIAGLVILNCAACEIDLPEYAESTALEHGAMGFFLFVGGFLVFNAIDNWGQEK